MSVATAVRATRAGVEIGLKVVPRAKHPGLDGLHDGGLKLRLSSPPVDGKARKAGGERMGSRMFYGYFPDKDVVIAIGVNSAGDKDGLGLAIVAAYEAVTGETVDVTPAKK